MRKGWWKVGEEKGEVRSRGGKGTKKVRIGWVRSVVEWRVREIVD